LQSEGSANRSTEVDVFTGKEGQTVSLHDSHYQSIAVHQAVLSAEVRGERDVAFGNGQYIEADQGDLVHRLACTAKLLDLGRVLPQPLGNALRRPTESLAGLDCHQPVHEFPEDMRRCEAGDLLVFDPIEELLASRTVMGMSREIVQEDMASTKMPSPATIASKVMAPPADHSQHRR
jgi:hypothetical protein